MRFTASFPYSGPRLVGRSAAGKSRQPTAYHSKGYPTKPADIPGGCTEHMPSSAVDRRWPKRPGYQPRDRQCRSQGAHHALTAAVAARAGLLAFGSLQGRNRLLWRRDNHQHECASHHLAVTYRVITSSGARILPVGFVLTGATASAAQERRFALFRRTRSRRVWAGKPA